MVEPILFPDVVSALRKHLFATLGVKTFAKIPDIRPDKFVTVTRTGGPSRDWVVDGAQITVDTWVHRHTLNTPGAEALALAQQVRAYTNSMRGQIVQGVQILQVTEFSGPAWVPDTLSSDARYRQSWQIGARGTPI